jgi:hypothetical protein
VLGDDLAPAPEGSAGQVDQQRRVLKDHAGGIEVPVWTSAPRQRSPAACTAADDDQALAAGLGTDVARKRAIIALT